MKEKICSVEYCDKNVYAINYCGRHYKQILTKGYIHITRFDKNKIIVCGNYAKIILLNNNNIVVGKCIIDIEDIKKIKKYKWHYDCGYCTTTIQEKNKKYNMKIHRLIMGFPDSNIDHINRNKLDNKKINLRCVGQSVNTYNNRMKSTNTSGVTGVVWVKRKNKWGANIGHQNKLYNLGHFTDKQDAINVRKEAELKFYGEYK